MSSGIFFCVGVNVIDQTCLGVNFFDSLEDMENGVRIFREDYGDDYIFLSSAIEPPNVELTGPQNAQRFEGPG